MPVLSHALRVPRRGVRAQCRNGSRKEGSSLSIGCRSLHNLNLFPSTVNILLFQLLRGDPLFRSNRCCMLRFLPTCLPFAKKTRTRNNTPTDPTTPRTTVPPCSRPCLALQVATPASHPHWQTQSSGLKCRKDCGYARVLFHTGSARA